MRPRSPDQRRPGALPETPVFSKTYQSEKYSPEQYYLQSLHRAMQLDRHADALLFMGRHAAAELVSFRAEALRAVSV